MPCSSQILSCCEDSRWLLSQLTSSVFRGLSCCSSHSCSLNRGAFAMPSDLNTYNNKHYIKKWASSVAVLVLVVVPGGDDTAIVPVSTTIVLVIHQCL